MSDELPERQLGERSTFAQEMRYHGSAALRIPSKERSAWLRSLSPRERMELREAGEVDAWELAHADHEARQGDLGVNKESYEEMQEYLNRRSQEIGSVAGGAEVDPRTSRPS